MKPKIEVGQIWIRQPWQDLQERHWFEKLLIKNVNGNSVSCTYLKDNHHLVIQATRILEEFKLAPNPNEIWKELNE
jgi:hypothetical protein